MLIFYDDGLWAIACMDTGFVMAEGFWTSDHAYEYLIESGWNGHIEFLG